jgi:hypothetical protein
VELLQFQPIWLLGNYAVRAPLLLLWLVGIVAALTRWRRMPRVALLVVLGLLIALADTIVGGILSTWLPLWLARTSGPERLATVVSILTFLRSLVEALAWGLVLVAAFRNR